MEKFNPETNVPAVIALQFADGKHVASQHNPEGQIRFTLVDGRPWYAPLTVAEKIRAAGVQAHKPFEIVKKEIGRNQFEYQIRLLAEQGRGGAPASSWQSSNAHSDTQPRAVSTQNYEARPQHTAAAAGPSPIAIRLCAALCAAVDAALETEGYAENRNMKLEFAAEDIRALAITVFIDQCKQNGGAR